MTYGRLTVVTHLISVDQHDLAEDSPCFFEGLHYSMFLGYIIGIRAMDVLPTAPEPDSQPPEPAPDTIEAIASERRHSLSYEG